MTMQLNPYLTFGGNAAEAMEFYASVFGGSVRSILFADMGMQIPGVMHAALETPDGFHLFASDDVGEMGPPLVIGNNIQVSISGDENERLAGYFAGLAEGGQVVVPLEKQAWGDEYGQLIDKFGITWHVNMGG